MNVAGIGHEQRIEERLVARLQVGQEQIFLQVVVEMRQFRMRARDLHFQRTHARRQQSFQMIFLALLLRKRGALIEAGIVDEVVAGRFERI